jgi:DNA repair exonuclease SbcCD ATPase subunit
LHDGVSTLQTQLTATSSSLQDVCDKAKEDPRPAFAAFDKNLSATEASYKRIESAIADARASADAYFADWEKQNATMTDASMKEAAQERRAKLTKALDPVVESMNEVRDELTPLLARFKDARTYLSNARRHQVDHRHVQEARQRRRRRERRAEEGAVGVAGSGRGLPRREAAAAAAAREDVSRSGAARHRTCRAARRVFSRACRSRSTPARCAS